MIECTNSILIYVEDMQVNFFLCVNGLLMWRGELHQHMVILNGSVSFSETHHYSPVFGSEWRLKGLKAK